MTCGLARTSVPTSIHCDHLIRASENANSDLEVSSKYNVLLLYSIEKSILCRNQSHPTKKCSTSWRVLLTDTVRKVTRLLTKKKPQDVCMYVHVGIEFWRPGSGIIHQVVLENYASPGMLMYASALRTSGISFSDLP